MNKIRTEMAVGFFVVIGLVILSLIVFAISGVYMFKPGYHINVIYTYVSGVNEGAPVRLSGVIIGEITDLNLVYDEEANKPVVKLTIFVEKDTKLREGDKFRIYGIYGLSEGYIEIVPCEDPEAMELKDGDTVRGIDPIPIEVLVDQGKAIAAKLGEIVGDFSEFVRDEEVKGAIKDIIINIHQVTNALAGREGEEVPKAFKDLEVSIDHLKNIMTKIDNGEGTLGKLISDDEVYNDLRDFMKEIKKRPWRLIKRDVKAPVTGEDADKAKQFR